MNRVIHFPHSNRKTAFFYALKKVRKYKSWIENTPMSDARLSRNKYKCWKPLKINALHEILQTGALCYKLLCYYKARIITTQWTNKCNQSVSATALNKMCFLGRCIFLTSSQAAADPHWIHVRVDPPHTLKQNYKSTCKHKHTSTCIIWWSHSN